MRFLNNNFYLICIFAGGMGALIMFYFLFHETFFNGNPIHPGFEGTYNGIQNYLLEYPKLIFMVWFAITRMAFYFIVLTPLLLFFADEWKKNKTISVAGKLARIILPLLPLLVIRLVISTYKTHTDSVQNQLLESSETILTTSSVIGLFIAIVTAFGMILSAVRASSIKNFSISDYNDSLKSINYFMIILGITASF
jgi:hypothetical protein